MKETKKTVICGLIKQLKEAGSLSPESEKRLRQEMKAKDRDPKKLIKSLKESGRLDRVLCYDKSVKAAYINIPGKRDRIEATTSHKAGKNTILVDWNKKGKMIGIEILFSR
jgi:uncharacterized protein YuzE